MAFEEQELVSSQSQPCGAPESAATEAEPSAVFSDTDLVLIRMKAANVSDAAHLCYWGATPASYHRADLLKHFDALAELVARFRQSEAA